MKNFTYRTATDLKLHKKREAFASLLLKFQIELENPQKQ